MRAPGGLCGRSVAAAAFASCCRLHCQCVWVAVNTPWLHASSGWRLVCRRVGAGTPGKRGAAREPCRVCGRLKQPCPLQRRLAERMPRFLHTCGGGWVRFVSCHVWLFCAVPVGVRQVLPPPQARETHGCIMSSSASIADSVRVRQLPLLLPATALRAVCSAPGYGYWQCSRDGWWKFACMLPGHCQWYVAAGALRGGILAHGIYICLPVGSYAYDTRLLLGSV